MLSLPPSTPSEHSSPRIPEFAEVRAEEWQSFGVGDGGAIDRLGDNAGPAVHDILKDGNL